MVLCSPCVCWVAGSGRRIPGSAAVCDTHPLFHCIRVRTILVAAYLIKRLLGVKHETDRLLTSWFLN